MNTTAVLRIGLYALCLFASPLALGIQACSPTGGACTDPLGCGDPDDGRVGNPDGLPRLTLRDFDYAGAFRLRGADYGDSSANYTSGVLEHAGDALFIAGHDHDDAIAQFVVPELVKSDVLNELNHAERPVQNFSRVLDRASTGNYQSIDTITGMEYVDGKLIVNGFRYYDGGGGTTHTTLVVEDAANIARSGITGYLELPGGARSGGWISPVPPEWQRSIGSTHIVGHSSGTPIISRHSVGPSAHAVNASAIFAANPGAPEIPTTELLGFSLDQPLHDDLNNNSGNNDVWTHLSRVAYGFIVPGTRTYATIGSSGGHRSGVGYKLSRGSESCAGYCTYDPDDNYNYYWLWDIDDLLDVKAGVTTPDAIRPYEHGEFPTPFQGNGHLREIGGGTFDASSGTLYLSLLGADTGGGYDWLPVIVAYRFPALAR